MRYSLLAFATCALAARPFLNEPDTGIDDQLAGFVANGTLPPLSSLVGLPDFQWVGRQHMNTSAYTYYRNGAAGEWSYRNNLEVFSRYRLRPRVLRDITNIEASMPTTILGHNFSAPFFISPCARGGYANEDGELGLVKGAGEGNILYMTSLYSSKSLEDIHAARPNGSEQVLFQQVYLDGDMNDTQVLFKRIESLGAKAIVLTVDSPGDGVRHRAARYGVGSADVNLSLLTWDLFQQLSNMTSCLSSPRVSRLLKTPAKPSSRAQRPSSSPTTAAAKPTLRHHLLKSLWKSTTKTPRSSSRSKFTPTAVSATELMFSSSFLWVSRLSVWEGPSCTPTSMVLRVSQGRPRCSSTSSSTTQPTSV